MSYVNNRALIMNSVFNFPSHAVLYFHFIMSISTSRKSPNTGVTCQYMRKENDSDSFTSHIEDNDKLADLTFCAASKRPATVTSYQIKIHFSVFNIFLYKTR